MTKFTIDDLRRILRECAGENDSNALDGDIFDTTFEELGYDSLALLESASRVEREFHVALSDEAMADVKTPRDFVALVKAQFPQAT